MRPSVDQRLLQRIADSVPAIVALYNIGSGKYVYVNRGIARLLGYRSEDVLKGGLAFIAGLVHPQDIDRVMRENQQAVERANKHGGSGDELIASFEYRIKHKNGEWRWLHTDGTVFERDEYGHVALVLNVSLDITAQKQTEMQLSHSLKALENALKV
jgi:PAS domain S-box-containing protein